MNKFVELVIIPRSFSFLGILIVMIILLGTMMGSAILDPKTATPHDSAVVESTETNL